MLKISFCALITCAVSFLAYGQEHYGPGLKERGSQEASCHYDGDEFVLDGVLDVAAYRCFRDTFVSGTKRIRVSSTGGQASIGLGLSKLLQDEDFHLTVEGSCNSACALYILPIASELTVLKNSSIILHGSVSKAQLSQSHLNLVAASYREKGYSKEQIEKEVETYKALVELVIHDTSKLREERNIGAGWFMVSNTWMEDEDRLVTIAAEDWLRDNETFGVFVSPAFIKSCLPELIINQYYGPEDAIYKNDKKFQDHISRAKASIRPDAKCIRS